MVIPKEYVGVAVSPCVWGDPYLSCCYFRKKKKEKFTLYFGLYNMH